MTQYLENKAVPIKKGGKNPNRGVYTSIPHGASDIRVQIPTGVRLEITEAKEFAPDKMPQWVWDKIKEKPEIKKALKDKVLTLTEGEKPEAG